MSSCDSILMFKPGKNLIMVTLLPYYRGNYQDTTQNTPSPIRPDGLAKLHNAVEQFKIDKVSGNLANHLANGNTRAAKMAQPEWNGWVQYQIFPVWKPLDAEVA